VSGVLEAGGLLFGTVVAGAGAPGALAVGAEVVGREPRTELDGAVVAPTVSLEDAGAEVGDAGEPVDGDCVDWGGFAMSSSEFLARMATTATNTNTAAAATTAKIMRPRVRPAVVGSFPGARAAGSLGSSAGLGSVAPLDPSSLPLICRGPPLCDLRDDQSEEPELGLVLAVLVSEDDEEDDEDGDEDDDVESLDLVGSEPELAGVEEEPSDVLDEPRLSVL
jgi:hypothetical protein